MSFSASALASLPFRGLPAPTISLAPAYHTNPHLFFLSIALKNSLQAYSARPQPIPPSVPSQVPSKPIPRESAPEVIQILSDNQEPLPRTEIKQNTVLPTQGIKKNEQALSVVSCPPKQAELAPTSEDLHPTEAPTSPKPPNKTKLIKKQKQERKETDFIVEVPQVDLLDEAELPVRGVLREWVGRVREALIRRRVEQWVEPLKKQKKEVRLLRQ